MFFILQQQLFPTPTLQVQRQWTWHNSASNS